MGEDKISQVNLIKSLTFNCAQKIHSSAVCNVHLSVTFTKFFQAVEFQFFLNSE
jgi:hypothetical protein